MSTDNRSHPLTVHNSNTFAATTAAPKKQQQHLESGTRFVSTMKKCKSATTTTNDNNSLMPDTGSAVVFESTPQSQQQNSSPISTMILTGQVSSNQSPVIFDVITDSNQVTQGVNSCNSPQNSRVGVIKYISRKMPEVVGAQPGLPESIVSIAGTSTTPTQATSRHEKVQKKIRENIIKEKCHKMLTYFLEISSEQTKRVERIVRTLIQDLVDAKVEPKQFCDRIKMLLNISLQPWFIAFLKNSLPPLRQSLMLKEIVLDGIQPPQISAENQSTVVLANQQQEMVLANDYSGIVLKVSEIVSMPDSHISLSNILSMSESTSNESSSAKLLANISSPFFINKPSCQTILKKNTDSPNQLIFCRDINKLKSKIQKKNKKFKKLEQTVSCKNKKIVSLKSTIHEHKNDNLSSSDEY